MELVYEVKLNNPDKPKRLRTISEKELRDILDKHSKWLRGEFGGERADLSYVNFRNADLRRVILTNADLSNAVFIGADLYKADLNEADMSYTNLYGANLSGAKLSKTNFHGAILCDTDMRNVYLYGANLSNADLTNAILRNACLNNTKLSNTDLKYTDLRHVSGFKFKPLQITNTNYFITIFDDHILWGDLKITFDKVKSLKVDDFPNWIKWGKGEFELNKKIILDMIKYYRK